MSENGEGVETSEMALVPVAPSDVVAQTGELMSPEETPQPGLVPGSVIPALHLHRHEHAGVSVDDEARAVISRLAGQHGELFSYLHGEIRQLQESCTR